MNIIEDDIKHIVESSLVDWSVFKNRTVLVSGANGMLPSYMALALLGLNKHYNFNVKVLALVRNKEKAETIFADYLNEKHLEFLIQDVVEPVNFAYNIDYIIHGASQASPLFYGNDPVGTLKANTIGTINLLDLAKEKNVKSFLYFSTGAVYGEFDDDSKLIHENDSGYLDPLVVRNCYAESKRAGENACASYAFQYNVPTKIIRIFHTLGPNVNLDDGRAFSDFCKCIVEGKDIVLRSDGTAKRPFCYVSDAIVAYFKVMIDGEKGSAYNISGDLKHEVSMKDLAEMLVGLYPELGLKVVFDIPDNNLTYNVMRAPQMRAVPDCTKISELGWSQKLSVRETFKRTIDYKKS